MSVVKPTYTDDKGRTRWVRNDQIAAVVKQLGEFLIIGGYPEQHASRYAQLANRISRWPDCIDALAESAQLESIPGVGGVITGYLIEIIGTGTTTKFDDDQYGTPPPRTVLELTAIERLGPKTARTLYQEHGIVSLATLCAALNDDRLTGIAGIGPKMLQTIARHCKR